MEMSNGIQIQIKSSVGFQKGKSERSAKKHLLINFKPFCNSRAAADYQLTDFEKEYFVDCKRCLDRFAKITIKPKNKER